MSRHKVGQMWHRYRQDHPRAFKYREAVPATPFPFFHLPFELRRIILCLHLKHRKPVQQLPPNFEIKDRRYLPVDTRIFAVNKCIKDEAEKAFYAINTLRVNIYGPEDQRLPLWITSPPLAIRELRSVDLCLHPCNDSVYSTLLHDLPQITDVLENCHKLDRLRISPKEVFEVDLDDSDMLRVLLCLKSFEKVGKVVVEEFNEAERTWTYRLVSFATLLSPNHRPNPKRTAYDSD